MSEPEETLREPLHTPIYTRVLGRTLVSCSCGATLGKHTTSEQAAMRWMQHKEREPEQPR